MRLSKDFQIKLLDSIFEEREYSWLRTVAKWCIDSAFRKYKHMDYFLNDQIQEGDEKLRLFAETYESKSPELTAQQICAHVIENYTYKEDIICHKMYEHWAEAKEVFLTKEDDCEGLNSLIYILCRFAGIPAYLLYSAIVETPLGLHYVTLFYSPRYDKLVSLDAAYYPTNESILKRPDFRYDSRYNKILYLFNETGIWKLK